MSSPAPDNGSNKKPIMDLVIELLEALVDWLRYEVETIVREKVVLPLQRLGITLFAASAASCLAALGATAIAVGAFMLLGQAIGYAYALLLIGAVLLIGSVVFLIVKKKNMVK
ncbi:MAG: hypothetical protein KGZ89_07525 [Actinobacteria bacterium]|nr:hypothetical protein [Actinomycetota bacterium]